MQSAGSSSPHWIMVWFAGMLALVVATGRMEFVNAPYLQGFGWIAGLYLLAYVPEHAELRTFAVERIRQAAADKEVQDRFRNIQLT